MPPGSKIKSFVEVLQTGKTDFSRVMDNLFLDPGALPEMYPKEVQELRTRGGLDRLSNRLKELLHECQSEFPGIDQWPNDQKEQVRLKLVQAIDENRRVHFFWELYSGYYESSVIVDPGDGDIIMNFQSPQRLVRYDEAKNEIHVDVSNNDPVPTS